MPDIKDFEKAAREGKIDRREFIKRATALGLAAPFATSLLTYKIMDPEKAEQLMFSRF